jgi:hypothetical protein
LLIAEDTLAVVKIEITREDYLFHDANETKRIKTKRTQSEAASVAASTAAAAEAAADGSNDSNTPKPKGWLMRKRQAKREERAMQPGITGTEVVTVI